VLGLLRIFCEGFSEMLTERVPHPGSTGLNSMMTYRKNQVQK